MPINPGKLTLNIHVSVNNGDPLTVGYLEIDHVPSTAQMAKAFQALADGLTKKEGD